MTYCSHCHEPAAVSLYRLPGVGLRTMCEPCATRLSAMGMAIDAVGDADPRARQRRERVA